MPRSERRPASEARLRAMARLITRADVVDDDWAADLMFATRHLFPGERCRLQELLNREETVLPAGRSTGI